VLMDIGVSSLQLDTAGRGFAFSNEGPLDMRMDAAQTLTAARVVNTYPEEKLSKIIHEYGEEPKARSLAREIVKARKQKPLETTGELAALAKRVCFKPGQGKPSRHPATRLFQAIRMEVNGELQALEKALEAVPPVLKAGGRLAVITFHSLEDRLAKQFLKKESSDCICPPGLPLCVCGHKASLKILTPKPVAASEAEVQANPRSRSAKLREGEKLGGPSVDQKKGAA